MIKIFRYVLTGLAASALAGISAVAQDEGPQPAQQPAGSLSELIQRLEDDRAAQQRENRVRTEFAQRAESEQRRELQAAQDRLAELQALAEELTRQREANDVLTLELQDELTNKQGVFRDLFGVARTAAAEAEGIFTGSLISAEFRGRAEQLASVVEAEGLPRRDELDRIWQYYIFEMERQGQVARFTADVRNIGGNGETEATEVVRVGPFVAFTADQGNPRFLSYKSDGAALNPQYELTVLSDNPPGLVVGGARQVLRAGEGEMARGVIDPTRGTLLDLIVERPDLWERIRQGREVGFVIIGLAIGGVLFGGVRLVQLLLVGTAVRGQARKSSPSKGNPLGRVMLAADGARRDHPGLNAESFELALDSAILRETSGLDFGLNFIKLLAAVAPLLGLLGTVTGMIITFQQITLFGAGDPQIMAGGISQALVTTVLGLIAAIPLLFIHSLCVSASRGVQQLIEEQAASLIAEHALSGGPGRG